MKNEDGQTLIEVLVSFGVAVVLVSAITIAVLSALSNAQFSKNQNLATQYAQQGMEIIKQMQNNDFAAFDALSSGVAYCLDKNSYLELKRAMTCTFIDNVFVREAAIEKTSTTCGGTKVTVSTLWSDSKCTGTGQDLYCHSAKLVSCLSDSNIMATPGENPIPPTPTPTPTPRPPTPTPTDEPGED